MVFVAAGIRRSASTLVFQIACELVGTQYRIRRWREHPALSAIRGEQWWVAKSHNFLSDVIDNRGVIVPYLTIRDPRDIAVSMMTLHGNTFEKIMERNVIQRDIAHFNVWVDTLDLGENCFVDRYEDFRDDLYGLVYCIASVMGMRPTSDTAREIASKFSFENNKARSDTIGKSEPDLLFPGHLQTGGIGMWQDVLTAEQEKELIRSIGKDWFGEWGYM